MFFQQLQLGPMQNFCYLLGCAETKECAVIDCGFEHEKLLQKATSNGYKITKIFLTHFHYDHSAETEALAEQTGAKIFGHESAEGKSEMGGLFVIPEKIAFLRDDQEISIGNIQGVALHTPGHESSHMVYIFDDMYFFTGDCLFIGKSGRTDLPDSNPEDMQKSLERIKNLPDELIVYPGHDYGEVPFRTLGEEKELNPYLKGEMRR